MKTISLKISDAMVMRIEENLEKNNYATLSEFIRDAVRDKLDALENQKFESDVRNYLNVSGKNVEVAKTPLSRQVEASKSKNDIFLELERKFQELREQLE